MEITELLELRRQNLLTDEELALLGGDASHAHLVKGMDTVLLQKV